MAQTQKTTKAEVIQRVTEIKKLKLDGYTRTYIIQYGSKWSVSDRTIDEYISRATDEIREISLASTEEHRSSLVNAMYDLYRQAIKNGERQEASKLLMNIAKLTGSDQHVVQVAIEKREFKDVSNDEFLKMLNPDEPGE
jgi:flavin-binding protein dodecin